MIEQMFAYTPRMWMTSQLMSWRTSGAASPCSDPVTRPRSIGSEPSGSSTSFNGCSGRTGGTGNSSTSCGRCWMGSTVPD
jgi:hypothetical protein